MVATENSLVLSTECHQQNERKVRNHRKRHQPHHVQC